MSTKPSESAKIPGLSGKRVATVVVSALLLLGGGLSYTLWTYNHITDSSHASAEAWRRLAAELDIRYRKLERTVASGVDQRTIEMAAGEEFRLALDRFRTTTSLPDQLSAARRVERAVAGMGLVEAELEPSVGFASAQANYQQSVDNYRGWLATAGGRMLSLVLNFRPPLDFAVDEPRAA